MQLRKIDYGWFTWERCLGNSQKHEGRSKEKAYKDASTKGGFSSRIRENACDSFPNSLMRMCCGHTWWGLPLVRPGPPTLQLPSPRERLCPWTWHCRPCCSRNRKSTVASQKNLPLPLLPDHHWPRRWRRSFPGERSGTCMLAARESGKVSGWHVQFWMESSDASQDLYDGKFF